MFKISTRKILQFPLYFLFLPAFMFPLGLLIPAYYFFIIIIFLPYIFVYRKQIFIFVNNLYKKTPFKYFVYFSFWIVLANLFLLLLGKLTFISCFSALIIVLFGYFFLYILYPAFTIYKYFSIARLNKFLVFGLFIIFVWGIISFIGDLFNIKFLQFLENLFSNRQYLVNGTLFVLARARSFIYEPGRYAYFIALLIPYILFVNECKYRIFKNHLLNLIIKKSFLLLAIINLILTMSPIGIVFAAVVFLFCASKNILNILKKLKSPINLLKIGLILLLLFIICVSQYSSIMNSSVYSRIYIVVTSIKNIESLSFLEASLYTRIVSYVNSFCLFLHHSLLGVGLDQSKFCIANQFANSPILLSGENSLLLQKAYITGKMSYNRNIICDLLCETGIFGFLLFYVYLIQSLKTMKRCIKYYTGCEKDVLSALYGVFLMMILFSFYEVSIVQIQLHFFIFAFANVVVLKTKERI